MNHTSLTVVGNLATEPVLRRTIDGTPVVNFRLASTERRFDRDQQCWTDGDTLFISVSCWRKLAEHVDGTLRKGDPVVAIGKVFTRHFEYEGQARVSTDMTATVVGPDLGRCAVSLDRGSDRSDVPVEIAA